jgi:hypothetical protein
MASSDVTVTADPAEIRRWAEKQGGRPAAVKGTGRGKDPGILRIDFPGWSGEQTLRPISWEEFFDWFDRNQLALIYRKSDRFNKIVSRKHLEEKEEESPARTTARRRAPARTRAAATKSRATARTAARATSRKKTTRGNSHDKATTRRATGRTKSKKASRGR